MTTHKHGATPGKNTPIKKAAGGYKTTTATASSAPDFTDTTAVLVHNTLTLTTTKTEARVDSRVLAGLLGVKARASFALIERYADTFKTFGQLTFKKAVGERQHGGGNAERYALLNEDQAYFLLSLSRNNERVVVLKAKLVKAFGEARKANELRQTEYLPGYHTLHDEIHVRAAGSPNEKHVHINVNRLINKVAGIESGQRTTAPLPTQSIIVVAQLMAAQAMRSAPDHHEGYKLAKAAVEPLLALSTCNTLKVAA